MNGALHHCSHSKSLVWDWFVPEPLLMPCSCYTCRHGWQLRHCTPRVESHYVHDLHLSDQEPYLLVFAGIIFSSSGIVGSGVVDPSSVLESTFNTVLSAVAASASEKSSSAC